MAFHLFVSTYLYSVLLGLVSHVHIHKEPLIWMYRCFLNHDFLGRYFCNFTYVSLKLVTTKILHANQQVARPTSIYISWRKMSGPTFPREYTQGIICREPCPKLWKYATRLCIVAAMTEPILVFRITPLRYAISITGALTWPLQYKAVGLFDDYIMYIPRHKEMVKVRAKYHLLVTVMSPDWHY